MSPADTVTGVDLSKIVSRANSLGLLYLGSTDDEWHLQKKFQKENFLGRSYSSFVRNMKQRYDPKKTLRKDWC